MDLHARTRCRDRVCGTGDPACCLIDGRFNHACVFAQTDALLQRAPSSPLTAALDMQALFVHGMGRSPASAWPMLRQLRRAGFVTSTFAYAVRFEGFERISKRLAARIAALAAQGDYVLIGHSLGGVLIRASLNMLARQDRQPRHVFLLGSPVVPSRVAKELSGNAIFRALTRDCGQLLASAERMAAIGPVSAPTTAIAGVRGLAWKHGPFGAELNDGVVSLSEVSAAWITDQVQIHAVHTWLPADRRVAETIVQRVTPAAAPLSRS